MSDSNLLSSEASLSSSDSLDSFSNFGKLKPYDFEPTVSGIENTDREVSSSAMQTKGAEKEQKGNLDCCLCGKCNTVSTNVQTLCWDFESFEKNEVLMATFFISDYIISISCIQNQAFGVRNNRNLFEIKI